MRIASVISLIFFFVIVLFFTHAAVANYFIGASWMGLFLKLIYFLVSRDFQNRVKGMNRLTGLKGSCNPKRGFSPVWRFKKGLVLSS